MPPKGRGRRKLPNNGIDTSTEEVFDIISLGDASDSSSVVMTGQRPVMRGKRNQAAGRSKAPVVPEVYQDMLAEALASPSRVEVQERPRKRRQVKRLEQAPSLDGSIKSAQDNVPVHGGDDDDDDMNMHFEDVLPSIHEQTVYNDSDEGDSDDGGGRWEEVDMPSNVPRSHEMESDHEHLDLTLAAVTTPQRVAKRKGRTYSKAERGVHLEIHKLHLLCLLRHVDRRNDWCNDKEVELALKPLLSAKILRMLRPPPEWDQFRRAESINKGVAQAGELWESKFSITARGMRRSFWAANERDLQNFKLPADCEPPLEKADFRAAAKKLEGSRDVGAQLYCALMRSAGLEARLVCSLQPLPFLVSSKATTSNRVDSSPYVSEVATPDVSEEDEETIDMENSESPFIRDGLLGSPGMPFSARRRLGHPNAADYHVPQIHEPASRPPPPKPKRRRIRESPYPIFWVEVLEEAHQKWMPLDPLVTKTVNKPRVFEPPAADAENNLAYVIAFAAEGTARDVTQRYTKWYLAKTRKHRVESTDGGEKWFRRTMRFYSRGWKSDLDQIEDIDLAAIEAREGMPTSIADFKDHPRYALERDLKRSEVLVNGHAVGKVAAGRDPSSLGGKGRKMEVVYRRSDVKTVRSADGWYRIGREVKIGEQPVKTRATTRKRRENDDGYEAEDASTALYTESQTEIYEAPPVVNGRVPRNIYGNLDLYVPSMVPKGGVHIPDANTSRAARLLGIDYADAVTGFEFRGRHGTAVINGAVVATQYQEAVEAVLEGFRDQQASAEEEMRSLAALRMWKRLMVGLRIKQRVDGYEVEGEEGGNRHSRRLILRTMMRAWKVKNTLMMGEEDSCLSD